MIQRRGESVLRQSAQNPSSPLPLKDLHMRKLINRFRREEEGAALVEYGMLVGLIAVICIVAVTTLGTEISTAFSTIAADLSGV